MGLISGIYNMARQSEQDDLRQKQYEEDMQLKREIHAKQMEEYARKRDAYEKAESTKESVYNGLNALGAIDDGIADTRLQKSVLEQKLQSSGGSNPEEIHGYMKGVETLSKRLESLDNLRKVKEAEMTYKSIDAGFAKPAAMSVADAIYGIRKNESGMATVTRKVNSGQMDENGMPIYDTVRYKVPSSQFGGYADPSQSGSSQQAGYDPVSMGGALIDSNAPLGSYTPEYASPLYASQSRQKLEADVSAIEPDQGNSAQPQAAPASVPANQPMSVPQVQPQADTESIRQQALAAMSRAQTPEQRQRIKDRAAQMGVNLP
jgi:hypothetical protein